MFVKKLMHSNKNNKKKKKVSIFTLLKRKRKKRNKYMYFEPCSSDIINRPGIAGAVL